MIKKRVRELSILFNLAAEKGILLIIAAVLGAIFANTDHSVWYDSLLHSNVSFSFSTIDLKLTMHHFVNDFLMAIFFLVIGLEIKNEIVLGHLSSWKQRILPLVAAIGGMVVPIIIYVTFNYNNGMAMRGWAVPGATDIAFALGMLALFGKGLPVSLRVFLTALAIIDDLFAVVIIALFYSTGISNYYLGLAFFLIALLFLFNRLEIYSLMIYIISGLFLWYFFYKSGIHATVGGVILGLLVPIGDKESGFSPLKHLEKSLEKFVAFIVLPVFAFFNCGVSISGETFSFTNSIVLGTALGLFFGKQIGVFLSSLLAFKTGLSDMPNGTNLKQFYGVSCLCGIGFTMSLFIAILAFEDQAYYLNYAKLGVLFGSVISAILGALVLKFSKEPKSKENKA